MTAFGPARSNSLNPCPPRGEPTMKQELRDDLMDWKAVPVSQRPRRLSIFPRGLAYFKSWRSLRWFLLLCCRGFPTRLPLICAASARSTQLDYFWWAQDFRLGYSSVFAREWTQPTGGRFIARPSRFATGLSLPLERAFIWLSQLPATSSGKSMRLRFTIRDLLWLTLVVQACQYSLSLGLSPAARVARA